MNGESPLLTARVVVLPGCFTAVEKAAGDPMADKESGGVSFIINSVLRGRSMAKDMKYARCSFRVQLLQVQVCGGRFVFEPAFFL